MYALQSELKDQPVVSLQTGQPIATINQAVLDMGNLEVTAYMCAVPRQPAPVLVMAADIRQYAPDCIIIDDEEQLTDPADIVRLSLNPQRNYSPLGKTVVADTGRRLGTVEDYSINLETSRVQRLYIQQPLWRSWFGPSLIIDRIQIIDVTSERIIVRDATITDTVLSPDPMPEINP
jgi:sporulation protein YlmC with PRC-barrel domain